MDGSIMVDGVLTCCTLLHFMCDLKTAPGSMQHRLILELMIYNWTTVQEILLGLQDLNVGWA